MMNPLSETLIYCNREQTRKCERYMKKHKCTFIEAFNKLYGTNHKHTYNETLERLSIDTRNK